MREIRPNSWLLKMLWKNSYKNQICYANISSISMSKFSIGGTLKIFNILDICRFSWFPYDTTLFLSFNYV